MPATLNRQDLDTELIERSKEGDTRAFDQIILKYGTKLFGFVYHMISNKKDANDLLQEIFGKIYASLGKFNGQSPFIIWLYQSAFQTTLNFLKKRHLRPELILCDLDSRIQNESRVMELVGELKSAGGVAHLRELQRKINSAFQQLSEDHRVVVILFDIQGFRYEEIARIIRVSEEAVRFRIHHAHLHLQSHLASCME